MSSLLKRKHVLAASKGAAKSYQQQVIADGANHYWKLDEISGTTAVDSIGGTNGIIAGTITLNQPGAISLGKSMLFDGTSGKISGPVVSTPTTITLEGWIKRTASGGSFKTIISTRAVSPSPGELYFGLDPSNKLTVLDGGGASFLGTTVLAIDGLWHHCVVVISSSVITIYIDGMVDATGALAHVTTGNGPLGIGFDAAGSLLWSGNLDEIATYPLVLTPAQILNHYNAGIGGQPFGGKVSTANLISHWRLNEINGTRFDSFGTNHLTPNNGPIGVPAKLGNGCDFEETSSQWLNYPDVTPIGDADFTYAFWFKRESITNAQTIVTKSGIYTIYISNSPGGWVYFFIGDSGLGQAAFGAPDDTNWHFVVAWHDSVANTINVQTDNGIVASAATSGPIPASGAEITIGRSASGQYFDGIINSMTLFKRILTATERSALFNSGNGLAF